MNREIVGIILLLLTTTLIGLSVACPNPPLPSPVQDDTAQYSQDKLIFIICINYHGKIGSISTTTCRQIKIKIYLTMPFIKNSLQKVL
jgi:hypothetical protein